MPHSGDKGKRGELEVAALLRGYGFEARRGRQYSGVEGRDVLSNLPDTHIEVKRCERLHLWIALDQAARDAEAHETPVVFHRPNNRPWVVILPAEDYLKLMVKLCEK